MRHAKSSYPTGVADHGRPLAARANARPVWRARGSAITQPRSNGSSVHRPPAPARSLGDSADIDAPVDFLTALYGATPGSLISEVNAVDDAVRTLLVVGHEPTMSQVAPRSAAPDGSNRTVVREIAMKFPTSGSRYCACPAAGPTS